MIKIESQEDLAKLDNKEINPLIIAYIRKYFLFLIRQYKCPDLSQVGAIYLLESEEDLLLHSELGLSAPLERSVFEFADLLTLQSATDSTKLWHCCFILTNDNAISLFAPADLLLFTNLESCLKEDYTTRTIQIEERKKRMPIEVATIKCKSIFSDNSQHRYQMSKIWDKNLPQANIITISPSECHNIVSDLTTNIITNNLYLLGFGGYTMTNLISKIGVDVKKIKNTKNLWNSETDKHILSCAESADKTVVAFGSFAKTRKQFADRERQVLELLKPYQDKIFQITDGADRQFLHPLTPCVRNSFILEPLKIE